MEDILHDPYGEGSLYSAKIDQKRLQKYRRMVNIQWDARQLKFLRYDANQVTVSPQPYKQIQRRVSLVYLTPENAC